MAALLQPGGQVHFVKWADVIYKTPDQEGPDIVVAMEDGDKVWIKYQGSLHRVAVGNVRLGIPVETEESRYVVVALGRAFGEEIAPELSGPRWKQRRTRCRRRSAIVQVAAVEGCQEPCRRKGQPGPPSSQADVGP